MITVPCAASSSCAAGDEPECRRAGAAPPGRPRRARAAAARPRRAAPTAAAASRSTIDGEAAEPVRRVRSSSSRPRFASRASTAEARQASAAAIARSAPGSTSSAESASVSPAAASALAAGGIPSRSAIALLERLQPLPGRARPLGDVVALGRRRPGRGGRLVGALPRARPASSPPRRAIARASSSSPVSVSTSAAADSCRRPSRSRAAPSATSRRLAPSWPPVASGERRLDAAALGAQLGEPRLGVAPRAGARRPRRAHAQGAPARPPARGPRPRRARSCRGSPGRLLEDAHGLVAAIGRGALGLGEIAPQALLELGRRLAAQHEPLARLPGGGRGRRAPPRARRPRPTARPRPAGAPRAARSASPGRCGARSRRRRGAPRRRPGARPRRRGRAARSAPAGAAISTASFSARSAAVAWSASGRSRLRTSSSTSFARSTWIATRASLSSARCLRRLNLPSPAASSTRWRRSSGFEASTASTLPCETIECIEPPRPTSASSSTRSVRRTAALLTRYWPSPPRTSRRVIAISLKSTSSPKPPSSLSKTSSTSQ